MQSDNSRNPPQSSQNLLQLEGAGVVEDLHLPSQLRGKVWVFSGENVRSPYHRHEELELNLGITGRATYLVAGRRVPLTPRTLLWLFPGQDHVLVEQTEDFTMWIAVFRPALLEEMCRNERTAALRQQSPPGTWWRRLGREVAEQLEPLYRDLAAGAQDVETFNAGLAYLLLVSLGAFEKGESVQRTSAVHPAIERAARLLRDSVPPPAVPELARLVGLSQSRLSRLFKSQTGTGLVQFRQKQCLDRFLRCYDPAARVNLSLAAERAGFSGYSQFHRVFREQMGQSPAQWLRDCSLTHGQNLQRRQALEGDGIAGDEGNFVGDGSGGDEGVQGRQFRARAGEQ